MNFPVYCDVLSHLGKDEDLGQPYIMRPEFISGLFLCGLPFFTYSDSTNHIYQVKGEN